MGFRSLSALAGVCALATAVAVGAPVDAHAALGGTACSGVQLTTADAPTLGATIASYPSGTTFCLSPGEYTLTAPIKPAAGDVIVGSGSGAGGTELRGDHIVTGWTTSGGLYVHTGDVVRQTLVGSCASGSACRYPDDLYWNGVFMHRVLAPCTVANVVSGTYCIDYATDQIYIHDNPAGAVVSHAVVAAAIQKGTGVQLDHFAVSHFASPAQFGAVTVGSSSTADDLTVSYNHGAGIKMVGNKPVVVDSEVFDNGQEGVASNGADYGSLAGNLVHDNNLLGFNAHWDAGGAKFANTLDMTVSDNDFYANGGNGLWIDVDSEGTAITGNTSSGNLDQYGGGDGIRVEISCNVTVTGNSVLGNSRHGISVSDAHNVTVGAPNAGNTVSGNGAEPVWMVGNGRINGAMPLCHPNGGAWTEAGDVVQGNVIQVPSGSELGFAITNGSITTGSLFTGNSYTAVAGCAARAWRQLGGAAVGFATWQSAGEDAGALGSCQT